MKAKSFMLIAGEASGDLLAAELVGALRARVLADSVDVSADVQPLRTALAPRFFGAGGPQMASAGVELAFDLTQHSVIGISEVFKKYFQFRKLFNRLLKLAITRQPDVIIGVDYGGFNLRFGRAIKNYVRRHLGEFTPWNPRIVQFVSPQVWATRPGRAQELAAHIDLLLCIFPFEKHWYARRAPTLRVKFVGHPMVGRVSVPSPESKVQKSAPLVILLPGSREDELRRHLPVICDTTMLLQKHIQDLRAVMVLPNEKLKKMVDMFCVVGTGAPGLAQKVERTRSPLLSIETRVGGLAKALAEADLAITKSGTITMECARSGVPAVVFYKTSWPTYWIARQMLNIEFIAMPNLLAGEGIFPEFIQAAATPENLARAALELLSDGARQRKVKAALAKVMSSLGGPGASARAAEAIVRLCP